MKITGGYQPAEGEGAPVPPRSGTGVTPASREVLRTSWLCGEHAGHEVKLLAPKHANLVPFYCVTCQERFAVLLTSRPFTVVDQVPSACPECGKSTTRWEVCAPELCWLCYSHCREELLEEGTDGRSVDGATGRGLLPPDVGRRSREQ
jgi:hypothetical protein